MNEQISRLFICRCASDILNGLSDGLTHYSMASTRAALLFSLHPDSPILLCDPQNLLKGHEPILKMLYVENQDWRWNEKARKERGNFADITAIADPGLAGLLSSGGYSSSVFFQQWFTEHHPDLCSPGPTECWLEHAVWRFSHDMANKEEFYTGISGYFLKEYATHAVRDYIIDQMNRTIGWDSSMRIYPLLDVILMLSETMEEGCWPKGRLLFVEPCMINQLDFLVRFQEDLRPRIANIKHVRKLLLTVEHSSHYLVSDGQSILGICGKNEAIFSLCADFRGHHGFLQVNRNKICSFSEGRFSSTTYQAKLVQLEELLLELPFAQQEHHFLFTTISALVCHAQSRKHGCAVVLDFNEEPIQLSGQTLSPPLDLHEPLMLEIAKSLAKVDGALHIGKGHYLLDFACLLDGKSFLGENLARGARYNSALRFTAEHKNIVVVVVSSDRPVSVIHRGVEMQGGCEWRQSIGSVYDLTHLDYWVDL